MHDIKHSCPRDYFNLQLTPGYIANICKGTSYRTAAEGVGIDTSGSENKEFGGPQPLVDAGISKFIGILFANGPMPRLFFKTWLYFMLGCLSILQTSIIRLECGK
jgi:hypothetical protein